MTDYSPTISPPPQITLASASPRRRELLDQIQVSYEVLAVDIDEAVYPDETPTQYVQRLAMEKARAGYQERPVRPALGSDTIVVIDSAVLGKPLNKEHGLQMLGLLSGRTHKVMTAVALHADSFQQCSLSMSEVTFAILSDEAIDAYWETGEPVDKAGGYAVQGIAAQFIQTINGSYSGIMGLPLYETAELLKQSGIKLLSC